MNPILLSADANGGGGAGSLILMIVLYGALFAALYFFKIRPQSRRGKKEAMRKGVQVGDDNPPSAASWARWSASRRRPNPW